MRPQAHSTSRDDASVAGEARAARESDEKGGLTHPTQGGLVGLELSFLAGDVLGRVAILWRAGRGKSKAWMRAEGWTGQKNGGSVSGPSPAGVIFVGC